MLSGKLRSVVSGNLQQAVNKTIRLDDHWPLNEKFISSKSNSYSNYMIELNYQEEVTFTGILKKSWKLAELGIHEDNKATLFEKSKRKLRFMKQSNEHD